LNKKIKADQNIKSELSFVNQVQVFFKSLTKELCRRCSSIDEAQRINKLIISNTLNDFELNLICGAPEKCLLLIQVFVKYFFFPHLYDHLLKNKKNIESVAENSLSEVYWVMGQTANEYKQRKGEG
jgi:hypothetical protein